MTPNLMMLGRELPMPSHLLADPPEEVTLDRPDYVQNLIKSFQGALYPLAEAVGQSDAHRT